MVKIIELQLKLERLICLLYHGKSSRLGDTYHTFDCYIRLGKIEDAGHRWASSFLSPYSDVRGKLCEVEALVIFVTKALSTKNIKQWQIIATIYRRHTDGKLVWCR